MANRLDELAKPSSNGPLNKPNDQPVDVAHAIDQLLTSLCRAAKTVIAILDADQRRRHFGLLQRGVQQLALAIRHK